MGLQPLHQRLGRASLEDGHRLLTFHVHPPGGLGRATAKREGIAPPDTRRGEDQGLGTLRPNEGGRTGPIPKPPGDACGHLGAPGMRQGHEGVPPALGVPRLRGQAPWPGFHAEAPGAFWRLTKAAAGVHHQWHWPPSPRQIPRLAPVATMDTSAVGATHWTSHRSVHGFQREDHTIVLWRDPTDPPGGRIGTQGFERHRHPPWYCADRGYPSRDDSSQGRETPFSVVDTNGAGLTAVSPRAMRGWPLSRPPTRACP
jgi:hypothetical protein